MYTRIYTIIGAFISTNDALFMKFAYNFQKLELMWYMLVKWFVNKGRPIHSSNW